MNRILKAGADSREGFGRISVAKGIAPGFFEGFSELREAEAGVLVFGMGVHRDRRSKALRLPKISLPFRSGI